MHLSLATLQSSRYFKSKLRAKLKAIGHSSEEQCGSLPVESVCWTRLGVAGTKKKKKKKKIKRKGGEAADLRRIDAISTRERIREAFRSYGRVWAMLKARPHNYFHIVGRAEVKPVRRSIDLKCHFQHRWGTWARKCIGIAWKKGSDIRAGICLIPLLFFVYPFFFFFFFSFFRPRLLHDLISIQRKKDISSRRLYAIPTRCAYLSTIPSDRWHSLNSLVWDFYYSVNRVQCVRFTVNSSVSASYLIRVTNDRRVRIDQVDSQVLFLETRRKSVCCVSSIWKRQTEEPKNQRGNRGTVLFLKHGVTNRRYRKSERKREREREEEARERKKLKWSMRGVFERKLNIECTTCCR